MDEGCEEAGVRTVDGRDEEAKFGTGDIMKWIRKPREKKFNVITFESLKI